MSHPGILVEREQRVDGARKEGQRLSQSDTLASVPSGATWGEGLLGAGDEVFLWVGEGCCGANELVLCMTHVTRATICPTRLLSYTGSFVE
jgi:hypothetical protein